MLESYAVSWRSGADEVHSGRLELVPEGLAFANGSETVAYGDLRSVHVGRSAADRIAGRPTLVLERHTGEPIRIAGAARRASSRSLQSIFRPYSERSGS